MICHLNILLFWCQLAPMVFASNSNRAKDTIFFFFFFLHSGNILLIICVLFLFTMCHNNQISNSFMIKLKKTLFFSVHRISSRCRHWHTGAGMLGLDTFSISAEDQEKIKTIYYYGFTIIYNNNIIILLFYYNYFNL